MFCPPLCGGAELLALTASLAVLLPAAGVLLGVVIVRRLR